MNEALIFAITRPTVWIPTLIGVAMLVGGVLAMKRSGTDVTSDIRFRLWMIPAVILIGYGGIQSGRAEVAYIWGWTEGKAAALAQFKGK